MADKVQHWFETEGGQVLVLFFMVMVAMIGSHFKVEHAKDVMMMALGGLTMRMGLKKP